MILIWIVPITEKKKKITKSNTLINKAQTHSPSEITKNIKCAQNKKKRLERRFSIKKLG